MLLPKDERKLLAFYYAKAGKTGQNLRFEQHVELMKVLGFNENTETGQITEEKFDRVLNANENLKDRGFINLRYENKGLITNVSLTLKGYDLGRKYNSRRGWFVEWLKEYWLIVTLSGGIIGFLIKLLLSYLQRTPGAK